MPPLTGRCWTPFSGRLSVQVFNAISVDGCMSTNDTAIILANGSAGNPLIRKQSKSLAVFRDMLSAFWPNSPKAWSGRRRSDHN